ncbi:MAG: trimethylamine methyltransferase [Nitrososphaeria archaeon]|nr:trimethylamine methyltransferase [Nitrososphaeria archaeon]
MVKKGLLGGKLNYLTKDEVMAIHSATLDVLEQVGMTCESIPIMEVFNKAGADVDFEDKRIRIPQHLVEEVLNKTPKHFVLCGRNPKNDILIENSRIYFGLGGTPTPYVRDIDTGEYRRPTKKDVADATRLGDALPNLSFIMSIAGAFDVPYQVEYLHEFEVMFNNTEKPIVYSTPGTDGARRVLEMAATITGGFDELRKRPFLSLYSETPSPLTITKSNENMIEFAKAGVPITLGPMPMAGATAPITISGAAVVGNTENLAAIALIQIVKPGTPVIYAGWSGSMDLRSGRFTYGSPEFTMGSAGINAAMARYYNLPTFGFGGCTDSKLPDAQAGAETMMNALMSGLCGINLIHDCGYLAGGDAGSLEMAVICDEVVGMVSHIVRGVKVDDESLAVDVIRSVGPGGHFLSQKHTLKFVDREIFIPKIFNRASEEVWRTTGRKDIREVAKERAKKLLKEHYPEPLTKDIQHKLSRILMEAEKELVKK